MTFLAYLRKANQLAKDRPELLQMEVVQANDIEGNQFTPVEFGLAPGLFLEDKEEFILEGEFELVKESDVMDFPKDGKVNAICIN